MGTQLPSLNGHSPQFSANVRCGETAGWTKMPLGMEVGLGPGDFVFLGHPTPRKRAQPHQIFGPCLLWANGWMDQDATWYGGKPRPRRRCVRWGRSSPQKNKNGAAPQFSVNVYCFQTPGWMKTPLGTEVDLGPGHIVSDGDPAPPRESGTAAPPLFCPCLLWPRSPISATAELLFYMCFRTVDKAGYL